MLRPRLWLQPWKGWLVVTGLAAAGVFLVLGLSLPVMRITRAWLWRDDYSLIDGVVRLWQEGYVVLAAVILSFSVIFPVAKLLALAAVCMLPMTPAARHGAARWIGILGRWSMLDVFVVAIAIVLSSANALGHVAPRAGLYVFTAAIVGSMILGAIIERRCAGSIAPPAAA